jgi:hypothetical protein
MFVLRIIDGYWQINGRMHLKGPQHVFNFVMKKQ